MTRAARMAAVAAAVAAGDGGACGGDGWQAITTEGADGVSSSAAACGGEEGVWRRGRRPGVGVTLTVGRSVAVA
ncbi:Os12g0113450 [Oryza sativa Japonica Group]|uniref:Os12g0113450 protein n=1 Tax=Oryza sativa subsp. japonica TaxID=39947 RepID=A0A0P0Y657_ORYSJ|nr:Os12g0113450 [Oryza sativa Japonica Group]